MVGMHLGQTCQNTSGWQICLGAILPFLQSQQSYQHLQISQIAS